MSRTSFADMHIRERAEIVRNLYAEKNGISIKQIELLSDDSTFGTVYKVLLSEKKTYVLKIIDFEKPRQRFKLHRTRNQDDIETIKKSAFREIDFLEYVKSSSPAGAQNIVRILDNGTLVYDDEMFPYFTMELLNDINPSPKTPWEEYEILQLGIEIAQGLECVHNSDFYKDGGAHRDVKDENILYREKQDGLREYVLIDFNISGGALGKTQIRGTEAGTEEFMDPEIVTGEYSNKVDIYSLAAVLYLLLNEGIHAPTRVRKCGDCFEIINSDRRFKAPATGSERLKELIVGQLEFAKEDRPCQTIKSFKEKLISIQLERGKEYFEKSEFVEDESEKIRYYLQATEYLRRFIRNVDALDERYELSLQMMGNSYYVLGEMYDESFYDHAYNVLSQVSRLSLYNKYCMAKMLENGLGIEQDTDRAIQLYIDSAAGGYFLANVRLNSLNGGNIRIPQPDTKAKDPIRKWIKGVAVGCIVLMICMICFLMMTNSRDSREDNPANRHVDSTVVDREKEQIEPSSEVQRYSKLNKADEIARCISNANDGDTIYIASGNYSFNKPIDIYQNSIKIIGESKDEKAIFDSGIYIHGSDVTIENISINIKKKNKAVEQVHGIKVEGGGKTFLKNTDIEMIFYSELILYGILLYSEADIENCVINVDNEDGNANIAIGTNSEFLLRNSHIKSNDIGIDGFIDLNSLSDANIEQLLKENTFDSPTRIYKPITY